MDLFVIKITIAFIVAIYALRYLWGVLFRNINKRIQFRVAERNGGYAVQVRGKYQWEYLTTSDGLPLIFADKMIAGQVVAEALQAVRDNEKGKPNA